MIRHLLFGTLTAALVCTGAAFAQDDAGEDRRTEGAAILDADNGDVDAGDDRHDKDMGPMTAEKVLHLLHYTNQKEVKMGELAQEKGESQEVKDFGQRLITDHQNADGLVKQVAQQENVTLKDDYKDKKGDHKARAGDEDKDKKKHKEKMEKKKEKMESLKAASGAEFDRKFTSMAAEGHAKLIDKLQKAQNEIDSEPVRQLITQLLPVLQEHHQIAERLSGETGGASVGNAAVGNPTDGDQR